MSQDKNSAEYRAKRNRKTVTILWGSFLGLGLVIAILMLLVYNGVIGYMPPIEELEDPHDKMASALYAADGHTELGRYFDGNGNRFYTDYDSVSHYVTDALIATEDIRFYEHSGIDFLALGRTGVKTLMLGDKSSGGGSTITQQLAKQLYSKPSRSSLKRAFQKPIEWMIAVKLERTYTKNEILRMYLNRFDFLNHAVGIKTAANVYFGKEAGELNLEEAAMLIGMLKNPSYFNPLRFPERTRERRNVVIDQMVKNGFISSTEGELAKARDLGLDYHKVDHREGKAPYLREEIRKLMTAKKPVRPKRSDYQTELSYTLAMGAYNTDSVNWERNPLYGWIMKNPKPDGSTYDLYTDGLRIYTTIDTLMQDYAEEAVHQYVGGTLQSSFTAEKRHNRYGPYSTNRQEISEATVRNLIKNAMKQTERYRVMKLAQMTDQQIDSAFNTKVQMDIFTYVTKNGKTVPGSKTVEMTPYDSLLYMKSILRVGMMCMDPVTGHVKAYVGGPDYHYFQYDMVSRGRRQVGSTIKPFLYALAMEQDYTPSSEMLNVSPTYGNWTPRGGGGGGMITLKQALTTSNNAISARLIDALRPNNLVKKMRQFGITGYIDPTYPLCLGTADISVKEMVSAYTAFSNKGVRVDPVLVTRIEDNQGNVIYSATSHRTEVLSEQDYYEMLDMLLSVVDNGTGRGLGSYGIPLGTEHVGGKTGTTNYNSDTWFIGFTPELVAGVWVGGEERYIHFNSMNLGQGARAALPVFGLFMKKVYADPRLQYNRNSRFTFPAGYSRGASYGGGSGEGEDEEIAEGEETTEMTIDQSQNFLE